MNMDSKPDFPDDLEAAIKTLSLAPLSESLDQRMATLFAEAAISGSIKSKTGPGPRWLATVVTIAASLLLGFGAGAWYGRFEARRANSANADARSEATYPSDETSVAGQVLPGPQRPDRQTIEESRTRTVARNTTLSTPLWLESKDGRVFRSYLAHTREDIVETDPATRKNKYFQRHTPRLVISNSPGI
jgi:hypothetical protein